MQDLQLKQYQKPTSTLEAFFDDVQADLEDTIAQLNNKLEKLDKQGCGYQYKYYTCEAGYTHSEQVDNSASPQYTEIEETILEIEAFIKSQTRLLKTINNYV